MLKSRSFFAIFLAIALLLRSTAGLAMQIEMAYGIAVQGVGTQSQAATSIMPPCHESLQKVVIETKTFFQSNIAEVETANYEQSNESTACSLCCVAAALPSEFKVLLCTNAYPTPTAVLFNNLPALALRPTKPPLS